MVSLALVFLWIPLITILIFVVWFRFTSLRDLQAQRALDRCVYERLYSRCETIRQIQSLNEKLHWIARAIAMKEVADKVGLVILPLKAITILLSAPAELLKLMARGIGKTQDALVWKDKLNTAQVLQCGFPFSRGHSYEYTRAVSFLHAAAQVPAPLELKDGPASSFIGAKKYKEGRWKESFGYCRGEDQLVSFTVPGNKDRSLLKRFFSF